MCQREWVQSSSGVVGHIETIYRSPRGLRVRLSDVYEAIYTFEADDIDLVVVNDE
jgi:hypothetical protein